MHKAESKFIMQALSRTLRLVLCMLFLLTSLLALDLSVVYADDTYSPRGAVYVEDGTVSNTENEAPNQSDDTQYMDYEQPEQRQKLKLDVETLSPICRIEDEMSWSVSFEGTDVLEYTLTAPDGTKLEEDTVYFTPDKDSGTFPIKTIAKLEGLYTLTVKVSNAVETLDASTSAKAMLADIFVSLESGQKFSRVNQLASFPFMISGGKPPYEVSLELSLDGESRTTLTHTYDQAGNYALTYEPKSPGIYVAELTVKDSRTLKSTDGTDNTEETSFAYAVVTLPVSSNERETATDWEESFTYIELSGDWREDLLRIAKTQLGYAESAETFFIDDRNTVYGYTRYGEWYGGLDGDMAYNEWCAMFISFCMHYAEIPADIIPPAASVTMWRDELLGMGLYVDDEKSFKPEAGDIVFFNLNKNPGSTANIPTHVGIVESVSGDKLHTIEGNHHDNVARYSYDTDSAHIIGYLDMEAAMRVAGKSFMRTIEADHEGTVLALATKLPGDVYAKLTPLSAEEINFSDDELLFAYRIELMQGEEQSYELPQALDISISSDKLLTSSAELFSKGEELQFSYINDRTIIFKDDLPCTLVCKIPPAAKYKAESTVLSLELADFEEASGIDGINGSLIAYDMSCDMPVAGTAKGSRIELNLSSITENAVIKAFTFNGTDYAPLATDGTGFTLTHEANDSIDYLYFDTDIDGTQKTLRLRIVYEKLKNYWTVEPTCDDSFFPEAPAPQLEAKYGDVELRWFVFSEDFDPDKSQKLYDAPSIAGKYILLAEVEESLVYTALKEQLIVSVYEEENPSGLKVVTPPHILYDGVNPAQSAKLSKLSAEKSLKPGTEPVVTDSKGRELKGHWTWADDSLVIADILGGKVKLRFIPDDKSLKPCICETTLCISMQVTALDQSLCYGEDELEQTLFTAHSPKSSQIDTLLCEGDSLVVSLKAEGEDEFIGTISPTVSVERTDELGNVSDVTDEYDIHCGNGTVTYIYSYVYNKADFNRLTAGGEKLNTIPADGSFTFRLDYAHKDFAALGIDFGEPLPKGTSIIMIDYSGETPALFNYRCKTNQSRIKLHDFILADASQKINFTSEANEDGKIEAKQLQFIVTLAGNASGKQYSPSLFSTREDDEALHTGKLPFIINVTDKASGKLKLEDAIADSGIVQLDISMLTATGEGRKILALTLTRDGKQTSFASGTRPIGIEFNGKQPFQLRGNVALFDLGNADVDGGGLVTLSGTGLARGTKYKLRADICIVDDSEMSYPMHGSKSSASKSFTA